MTAAVRVVVITDRRLCAGDALAARLAAILDTVPRGSVLVQVREKDLDGGPLLAFAREVITVARPRGAAVWVNDRVDVALAAGADGVHLPERGLTLDEARAVARGLVLGCSRHTREGVLAAAGVDLVQLGPIWGVAGKGEPLGPGTLDVRRAMAASVRLVAVGGIDGAARAREAAQAGADAVAVIRAAWVGSEPIAALVDAVEAGRRARPA